MIGGLTPERATDIQKTITEKTELRAGLLRTWKEKFTELKKLREEQVKQQTEVARLEAGGNLKRSDEDKKGADLYAMDAFDTATRDAQRYLDDAGELEREIEELKAELRDEGN